MLNKIKRRDCLPRTDIARKRVALELRQKEVAAMIGVSVSYLQKIELGLLPVSKRVKKAIASLGH